MFETTLDSICNFLDIEESPKTTNSKPFERLVMTFVLTIAFFIAGYIPLLYGPGLNRGYSGSMVAFYTVEGSLMTIGLQPFITVGMIKELVWKKAQGRHIRFVGFLWCVGHATIQGYTYVCFIFFN